MQLMLKSELIAALQDIQQDVRIVVVCPTGTQNLGVDLTGTIYAAQVQTETPEDIIVMQTASESLQDELIKLRASSTDAQQQYGDLLGRCITLEYQLKQAQESAEYLTALNDKLVAKLDRLRAVMGDTNDDV